MYKMYKTKNKRNKRNKKTRKYYGGAIETNTATTNPGTTPLNSAQLKQSDGVFKMVGDKATNFLKQALGYVGDKSLRLLKLKRMEPNEETVENTNKVDDTINNATEGLSKIGSKIGSDVVNVVDKGSAAIIENINDVLENPAVGKTVNDAAGDLAQTGTKLLQNFNNSVNTPEFKAATKVALDSASEIAEVVVQASEKPVNDAVDILSDAGEKAASGVASGAIKVGTDAMAAVPGWGAIVEVGKIANDLSTSAGDVVEAGTQAVSAITEVVEKTSENINEGLDKLEEVKQQGENMSNSMANVSNSMAMPSVKNSMAIPSVNIPSVNMPSVKNPSVNIPSVTIPSVKSPSLTQPVTGGGKKELKKLTNEGYQIGGRISDSLAEFTNPIDYQTMSILKGGNNKTKKSLVKSKGKSKRVRFYV
jgi:hypothetical protein